MVWVDLGGLGCFLLEKGIHCFVMFSVNLFSLQVWLQCHINGGKRSLVVNYSVCLSMVNLVLNEQMFVLFYRVRKGLVGERIKCLTVLAMW